MDIVGAHRPAPAPRRPYTWCSASATRRIRFAITYHRQVRGKKATQSVLDTIPGIGPKRKRALLRKFRSVRGIREATVDEVASTVGLNSRLAETVKRSL